MKKHILLFGIITNIVTLSSCNNNYSKEDFLIHEIEYIELNNLLTSFNFQSIHLRGDSLNLFVSYGPNSLQRINDTLGIKKYFKSLKLYGVEKTIGGIFYNKYIAHPDTRGGYFKNETDSIKFPFSKNDYFEKIKDKWYIFLDV